MKKFIKQFNVTPGGVWELDEEGNKRKIQANRVDNLSWDNYPQDNMGRHFLEHNYLVLDVDGEPTTFNSKDNTITIESLGITIPYGLYTQTTKEGKYHFYYNAHNKVANRLIGLHNKQVDVLTYGVVFEGHTFSPYNELHEGQVLDAPQPLIDSILTWQEERKIRPQQQSTEIGVTSNIQRYNVVTAFLNDELTTTKQWNTFFKLVIPREYQPKRLQGLSIKKYELSYDLFNKIAVKLTCTSELDFNSHTVPTLSKLLTMWGIDPNSSKSQLLMSQNILPSLPQHESIFRFEVEEDNKSFQEHLNAQKGTSTPIFRVIEGRKIMFLEVDKFSQLPIEHGGSFYLDKTAAQALHPERNVYSEEGRAIGWDDSAPIVYTINNPYHPAYKLDDKYQRHVVNLYTPTDYVQQAERAEGFGRDNLIYRALYSTIGPQYLPLYLAYSAQIVFGRQSPTMVLWMAALKTEIGGSGKSVVTLELFSLILASAAAGVDFKTVSSGWGDVVTSTKVLSLEDMPNLAQKEWESVYANIKQQNTNSYRKLNMKGASVTSERVSVAITGSTNFRPSLSSSDRRFLCLEPAHFHGITEPMNEEDRLSLARLLNSHDYSEEVQDYVNHLLYIYEEGFDIETEKALFIEAPQTEYRLRWVSGGESNSQNIINTISRAKDLMAMCKYETEMDREYLLDLFRVLMAAWSPDTKKAAVSWKWFEALLPYVQSDNYKDMKYAKSSIEKMLHIDFRNVGHYAEAWRKTDLGAKWAFDGYTFPLSREQYNEYKEVVR